MEELCGTVERIVYTSPDSTFCVLRMREKDSGKQVTVTGSMGVPSQGESIIVRGCWTRHPRFGVQFKGQSMEVSKPETSDEIENYLASGVIEGIGPAMAGRIVAHFGKDTLHIMDENIDALLEVPGIGEKTLQKIAASYEEVKSTGELIMLLQKAGISPHIAMEMQKLYGEDAEEVIRNNPYRMLGEIPGLGLYMPGHVGVYVGGGMCVDALTVRKEKMRNVLFMACSIFCHAMPYRDIAVPRKGLYAMRPHGCWDWMRRCFAILQQKR